MPKNFQFRRFRIFDLISIDLIQENEIYCSNSECSLKNISIETRKDYFFKRDLNVNVSIVNWKDCTKCSSILCKRFLRTPSWLVMQTLYDCIRTDFDLMKINLDNSEYVLFCCTIVSLTVKNLIFVLFLKLTFLIDD